MAYEFLELSDPQKGVARLTLRRERKKNALCMAMRDELEDAFAALVRNEAVHAVVVPKGGHECKDAMIIEHCQQRLASFKVPRSVVFADRLPKTGSGKIDKKALREPYWRGEQKRVR